MTSSIETLTRNASSIAIKSSGFFPHLNEAMSSAPGSMVPRVALSDIPTVSEPGWSVVGAVSCLVHIAAHADISRRTAYLVIDRNNAPLTGNYVVTLDATTYTYDATAEAPADVDELLAGVAALIDAGSIAAASAAAIDPTGDDNAIRLTAKPSSGSSFASFAINTGTAFPAGAALEVYAEFDVLSVATIYGKPGPNVSASVANSTPYATMVGRWVQVSDVITILGGNVPSGGYLERLNVAGLSAIMARVDGSLSDSLTGVVGYAGVMFMPGEES